MMNKPTAKHYGVIGSDSVIRAYPADEADAYIAHLEQRAEAAEAEVKHQLNVNALVCNDHQKNVAERNALRAKLAELEKQEPYGTLINTFLATDPRAIAEARQRGMRTIEVFTRPAPAVSLADLVPSEPTGEMQAAGACAIRFDTTAMNKLYTANAVYRAMRAVLLRNIEEAK